MLRVHHNMVWDDHCGVCGGHSETLDHLFQFCPMTYATWLCVVKSDHLSVFFEQPLLVWLKENLSSTETYDAWSCDWSQAFGSIVWSLWLNMNSLVFDPDFIGTDSVLGRSRWLVESYNLTIATPLGVGHGIAARPWYWIPQTTGFYKLNSDGSRCTHTGYASCGNVIQALAKMDSRSVGGYGVFLTPPSVIREVLRKDMNHDETIAARLSQGVQRELPTSGVG
ncbi:hypothetical protein V6N13_052689 [Hibiscus sabdariffa]